MLYTHLRGFMSHKLVENLLSASFVKYLFELDWGFCREHSDPIYGTSQYLRERMNPLLLEYTELRRMTVLFRDVFLKNVSMKNIPPSIVVSGLLDYMLWLGWGHFSAFDIVPSEIFA